MNIKYYHYRLNFRHTFHIAAGARNSTDAVFVELTEDGITGYGEVALPPYLPETVDTVFSFLASRVMPSQYKSENFFALLKEWSDTELLNLPAMAALDIALHDLQGKLKGCTTRALYNIASVCTPPYAFTIGMATEQEMKVKIEEAGDARCFKLKLGGEEDRALVEIFRKNTTLPFCVDANRGWKSIEEAVVLSNFLQEQGCTLIEQPFERKALQETQLLRKRVQLPVILDESVQTIADIEKVKDVCDGINIKLAKCGGIYPAMQMIEKASGFGLKIFIGCMSEGSCGIAGAAQLAPLADWVDLDGPLLISNDPFEGVLYSAGKLVLNNTPGTGAIKKEI